MQPWHTSFVTTMYVDHLGHKEQCFPQYIYVSQRSACATIPMHRILQGPHAFPPAPCGQARRGRWSRLILSCEGHIRNILATWVASLPPTYSTFSLCFDGCVCALSNTNLLFNAGVADINKSSPGTVYLYLCCLVCAKIQTSSTSNQSKSSTIICNRQLHMEMTNEFHLRSPYYQLTYCEFNVLWMLGFCCSMSTIIGIFMCFCCGGYCSVIFDLDKQPKRHSGKTYKVICISSRCLR